MTDLMHRLRAADPIRDELEPPPVDTLLARIEESPPATEPRRGRRRGGRVAGSAALRRRALVPAIVALLAVSTVVGLGQRSSPDVVAEARAALGSSGEIIHVVSRMSYTSTGVPELDPPILRDEEGRPLGRVSDRSERWTALDPLRERTRYTVVPEGGGAPHTMDITYADGIMRVEQSWMKELQTNKLAEEKYESVRGELSPGRPGPDPVAGVRALLAGGELTAAGEQTLDGRRVLRLVGEEAHYGEGAGHSGSTKVEYLVDAFTFVPVRITYDDVVVDRGRTVGSLRRVVTFEAFERLPATPANEALLRLP